jgi:hypothetical protein
MYNGAYLGEVNFWRDHLARSQPRIILDFGDQAAVINAELLTFAVRWPGVPGDTTPFSQRAERSTTWTVATDASTATFGGPSRRSRCSTTSRTQIFLQTTAGRPPIRRQLDHPSVIAWNLFNGLYFKSDGLPWGPVGLPPASCYIGVSFYRPLAEPASRLPPPVGFRNRAVMLRPGSTHAPGRRGGPGAGCWRRP